MKYLLLKIIINNFIKNIFFKRKKLTKKKFIDNQIHKYFLIQYTYFYKMKEKRHIKKAQTLFLYQICIS